MKPMFVVSAALAGIAVIAPSLAEARTYNGIVPSLYDRDGSKRPSVSASKPKAKSKKYYGKKKRKSARRYKRVRTKAQRTRGRKSGGATASRACLKPAARALLGRIEANFGPVRVISTCRPGALIAGSGKPSKHGFGLAVDFDAGARKGQIVQWLIKNHHSGGTMTYAGMSHIHVDIGPRFVSLGAGRRRR